MLRDHTRRGVAALAGHAIVSHSVSSHAKADKGDRVDCCAVGILVFLHFADELCFGGWDAFLVFW